jgi:eukaryotic-like serine/threonine-protein kinase
MIDSDLRDPAESEDFDEVVRAVAMAPPRAPPQASESANKRVGTVLLGKYRLDAVLGVGGMAIVYKATHRNGAEFAIKMLLPEHLANEDIRRRFRREGRFANAVQHPGAVSVIDDDVSDDGAAFLVLELLRGVACHDLAARCGRRLPIEAACAVGLQVLDVLQAAHDVGIIHRDIKPANLFVLRDGMVKVLDFGIARVRQTMHGGHATKSGAALGTPAFMAPEQALGASADIDGRVDVWAVGATLFTFLSGTTVSPHAHSLSTVDAAVPRELVDVIDRALQFDPALRWDSAHAMRNALLDATRHCFGIPPGQTVLALLLASEDGLPAGGRLAPERAPEPPVPSPLPASPKAAPIPPVAASVAPTARSAPVGPLRPILRAGPLWIASAAVLLAAGWFAALPRAPRPISPGGGQVTAAPPVPDSVTEDPDPLVPPPPTARKSRGSSAGGAVPRSCADARASGASSDGTVKIDPDGPGPLRAFEVFCTGMAPDSPPGLEREYITLAHSEATNEPDANASRYVWRGGSCDCPDLTRSFTRVRLDPRTMTIDPTDATFASYDRPLLCEAEHRSHCGDHTELFWGAPGSCRGAGDASGSASIDLRATPFALGPAVSFVPAGFEAAGRVTISKDRKIATLVGGGLCGSMVSKDTTIAVVQDR